MLRMMICAVLVSGLISARVWAEERQMFDPLEESKNQVIVLGDSGLTPKELHMKLEDSVVFFLNKSSSPGVNIEIDYGSKETHCASSNLVVADNGVVRSKRPIASRDFASVCFHDRGSYPLKVAGLRGKGSLIISTIVVE